MPTIVIVNTPTSALDEEIHDVVKVDGLTVINDVDYPLFAGCTVIV